MDRDTLRWTETLSPVRGEEEVAREAIPLLADTDVDVFIQREGVYSWVVGHFLQLHIHVHGCVIT